MPKNDEKLAQGPRQMILLKIRMLMLVVKVMMKASRLKLHLVRPLKYPWLKS